MEDTWFERDLPVLDAAVRISGQTGRAMIEPAEIERITGLDRDAVQQALRALRTGGYFEKVDVEWGGILGVSTPTAAARRVVGAWPSGGG
jgi:hypothetical protein